MSFDKEIGPDDPEGPAWLQWVIIAFLLGAFTCWMYHQTNP